MSVVRDKKWPGGFDTTSRRMDYEEAKAILSPHIGKRARITYPNGWQRVGLLGSWQGRCLTVNGATLMGELAGCTRIEIAPARGGRYEVVA